MCQFLNAVTGQVFSNSNRNHSPNSCLKIWNPSFLILLCWIVLVEKSWLFFLQMFYLTEKRYFLHDNYLWFCWKLRLDGGASCTLVNWLDILKVQLPHAKGQESYWQKNYDKGTMSDSETKGGVAVTMYWFSCCFLNVFNCFYWPFFGPKTYIQVPEWFTMAFFVMLCYKKFLVWSFWQNFGPLRTCKMQ